MHTNLTQELQKTADRVLTGGLTDTHVRAFAEFHENMKDLQDI